MVERIVNTIYVYLSIFHFMTYENQPSLNQQTALCYFPVEDTRSHFDAQNCEAAAVVSMSSTKQTPAVFCFSY